MTNPRIILSGMGDRLAGLQWESDKSLRIGRQGNIDVVLHDPSVDRLQAEVRWSGARWVIRDLTHNGAYPTLRNGNPLGRGDHPLEVEDILQFGKLSLKVTALEAEGVDRAAAQAPGAPRPKEVPEPSAVQPHAVIRAPGIEDAPKSPAEESIKTSGAFMKVKARTHQSWDQALEMVAFGPGERPQQGRAMLTLLRANHHLVHIGNLEELVNSILQDAISALGAQRGSLALFDETRGQLLLKAHHAPGVPRSTSWIYSKTLAERCYRQGESLLCQDVNADDDLHLARSVRQGSMSSIICALLRTPRKRIGVLQIDRGPFQEPFGESDLYLVDAIAASAAVGIESAQLVESQREQFIETVTTLARAVEMRDQYTGDHTRRVTDYALLLAEALKLPLEEKYQIQIGTPLHDIGKIGIDDAILRKPGKLTASEFE